MTKETTLEEARNEAETLRKMMYSGLITYAECRYRIQPFLDVLDIKGAEIAKKYGKKYYKINPSIYLR